MSRQTKKAQIGEEKATGWLRRRGAKKIRRSPGSRGPADIEAYMPGRGKLLVQVKTFKPGGSPQLDKEGAAALLRKAQREGGIPLLMEIEEGPRATFKATNLRTRREFKPKTEKRK